MFSCPIQIRMSDLDPFNHVNNGAQCHLFDYGRTQYFETVFGTQIDWLTFEYVLVHLEFDFRKQVRIHDQVVCETEIEGFGHRSLKMYQHLRSTVTNEILTTCRCVIVYIDRATNQSKEIPEEHRNMLIQIQ